MARPPGALGKRQRAALTAAQEGKLGPHAEKTIKYLLDLSNDPNADHATRIQAANAALQYVKPKLAAVETTNTDPRDQLDAKSLEDNAAKKMVEKPEILECLITMAVAKDPELHPRLVRLLQQIAPQVPASGNVLQIVK